MTATITATSHCYRMPSPAPCCPGFTRVHSVRQETVDTFTLEIKPPAGELCPRFLPGQFNMLYMFGVGEMAISISGDPWPGAAHSSIRCVPWAPPRRRSAVSNPATLSGCAVPSARPGPARELLGKDVVLAAGGIGLAPLRPTIYSILADRNRYGA